LSTVPLVNVTTTYLEMLDPARLKPRACELPGWQVRRAAHEFAVNRDFYRLVGADWQWVDRLVWSDERWQAYIDQPGLETWIGYLGGEPVGYCELLDQPPGGVELAYFGLLPNFIGRGLGAALLSEAISRAWARKPKRVWVHTCTLDHPQALANYLARGFEIYKTESHEQML
jgi:GNAT superfamily N-acetyltransferase